MKAKIIVEQYDNGISLKWSSPDHDNESVVALERDRERTLGNMIWTDIYKIMDAEVCNVVTINIEYNHEQPD
jgi:hypothetical protein